MTTEKVSEFFNLKLETIFGRLVTLSSRLEETVSQAISASEPAILAKYTFNLAKAMSLISIIIIELLSEENEIKRAILIVIADIARRSLTSALQTLGIEVPERM